MAFWKNNNATHGQLLIETLIAIGVFILFAGSFTLFAVDASRFTNANAQHIESYWLAAEGQSVLTALWKDDNSQFINGTHGLTIASQSWILSATPDIHDAIERSVVIENAHRDANGSLAETGTIDTTTKKITLLIRNTDTNTSLYRNVEYFAPLTGTTTPPNKSWLETTTADFQDGTFTRTTTTTFDDGEVALSLGASSGTYVSSAFDSGSATTNYTELHWSGSYNTINNIRIQIRIARNSGQLRRASWFGPDGTNQTYFSESDSITLPSNITNTTSIQYRIQFTRSGGIVPSLHDIEIVYE